MGTTIEFDFANKNYNTQEMIKKFRTDPNYALWLVDRLSDYEIAKVFIMEWNDTMNTMKKEK